ncbi:unnamed protein product, partial [marine sediment metagenome]
EPMEDPIILGTVGIVGIVACEIMALYKGVNGKRLATTVAAIGLITGFAFGVGV